MARQIIDSNAETIIGTIENYQVLKNIQDIIKKPLKFICIKTQSGEKMPSKSIDFRELSNPTSTYYTKYLNEKKSNPKIYPIHRCRL